MSVQFQVNGQAVLVTGAMADEPLLWYLREQLGLVGAKFGCGQAACGACTVHVNDQATPACVINCSTLAGAQVKTIEGLSPTGALHPVQQAWQELRVPQCGYCQAGQIMSAVALLQRNPSPSAAQIDEAMNGNLCRCGTYDRIRQAVQRAARLMAGGAS